MCARARVNTHPLSFANYCTWACEILRGVSWWCHVGMDIGKLLSVYACAHARACVQSVNYKKLKTFWMSWLDYKCVRGSVVSRRSYVLA